jgi:ElaB/YqjD/DUF883 family membrane-anchored ribosome-binding protein
MSASRYGSTSDLSHETARMSESAGRKMDRALDSAEQAVARAGEQGKQMITSINRTVREQPLLALAAVAAVGVVIGALWKLESSTRRRPAWY